MKKPQTWAARVKDPEKLKLAPAFIGSLALTAVANARTINDLWLLWQKYVKDCEGYDQSPHFREFCSWNELAGKGPLS